MLVLRRKIGEEVKIGDDVIVKVLAVNGRSIRLGIEAPRSTPVWRGEWLGAGPAKTPAQAEPVTAS
jgi:carbon storage regulator